MQNNRIWRPPRGATIGRFGNVRPIRYDFISCCGLWVHLCSGIDGDVADRSTDASKYVTLIFQVRFEAVLDIHADLAFEQFDHTGPALTLPATRGDWDTVALRDVQEGGASRNLTGVIRAHKPGL